MTMRIANYKLRVTGVIFTMSWQGYKLSRRKIKTIMLTGFIKKLQIVKESLYQ